MIFVLRFINTWLENHDIVVFNACINMVKDAMVFLKKIHIFSIVFMKDMLSEKIIHALACLLLILGIMQHM